MILLNVSLFIIIYIIFAAGIRVGFRTSQFNYHKDKKYKLSDEELKYINKDTNLIGCSIVAICIAVFGIINMIVLNLIK